VHCLGCPKRVNLWYSKFARVLRCVEAAQLSRSCIGIFNTVFFCLSVIAASTCRCRFCTSAFISLHLPSPLSRFKPPGVLANGTASTIFLIRPMAPEHQLPRGLMATFAVSSSELCRRWWLRSSHHWTRSFKPPSKLMMLLPALLRKIFYLFKSSYYLLWLLVWVC